MEGRVDHLLQRWREPTKSLCQAHRVRKTCLSLADRRMNRTTKAVYIPIKLLELGKNSGNTYLESSDRIKAADGTHNVANGPFPNAYHLKRADIPLIAPRR